VKFICYINIDDKRNHYAELEGKLKSEDTKNEDGNPEIEENKNELPENSIDDIHYNEEFRKRLIENNFDLMNGLTI
jgi:hypothetical protein